MVNYIVCSAVFIFGMLVTFFVMLYLMTTINPPLISIEEIGDNSLQESLEGRKFNNLLLNDAGLPIVEAAPYGLERLDAEEIDFYQSTHSPKYNNIQNFSGVFRFTPRNIVPPLWPRPTQTIILDPTMHVVIPPIWPTKVAKFDTMTSSSIKSATNMSSNLNTTIPKHDENSKANKTIVKSMKRRSVNNLNSNENSGTVILKILDTQAKSRIEIKLGSDRIYKKIKPFSIMGLAAKDTKFTMQSEINGQRKNIKLEKDTIITVMPNDSIIIDELEGKPVEKEHMDIKDLISSMIATDDDSEEHKEYPLYEDHSLVMDNKTKHLRNITANSYNFEITNSSSKNDTKSMPSATNTTDFDTMANTKINNTEFNKRIFEEEETVNTDVIVVKKHGNGTSFLSHIVNNYTDVLNENDSDLLAY